MMRDFFDRQGNPLTLWQWAEKISNAEYQRVSLETVGPYCISTVWIGLNATHGGDCPLLFETMVTTSAGHVLTQRYATEDEAVAGHQLVVKAMMRRAQLKAASGAGVTDQA